MPPSKLYKYLKILRVLTLGPQKIDSIAYGVGMECNSLKLCIDFLISYGIVDELRGSGKEVVYAINQRGLSVCETFRVLKNVDKLKQNLPIIEEAREVVTVPTKRLKKKKARV